MKRRETGILGERLAADYLGSHGYEVVGTNYRCRYGEIDIIARRDATLVFVEVRTRTSDRYGSPEESITPKKVAHLLAAADDYAAGHPGLPEERRIDVIAVRLDAEGKVSGIEHIENAVEGR